MHCTSNLRDYLPTNFRVDTSCGFRVTSRQSLQCKNEQKAITPKFGKRGLRFVYSVRSIYLQSFKMIHFIDFKLCFGQISKCKNEQRAITPKEDKAE
jgi:hypothetical protein